MTTTNDEKYNKIMREYHEFLKKNSHLKVEEVEHGDEIQPDDYNPFGEVEKPKRPNNRRKIYKGVIPAWAR